MKQLLAFSALFLSVYANGQTTKVTATEAKKAEVKTARAKTATPTKVKPQSQGQNQSQAAPATKATTKQPSTVGNSGSGGG